MMQIPLQAVPVQQIKAVLGGQNVQIYLCQRQQGLFADVNVNGVDVATGILALDAVPMVPRDYAGFAGNLYFLDTQGGAEPEHSGLGERFALVYLTADEYGQL